MSECCSSIIKFPIRFFIASLLSYIYLEKARRAVTVLRSGLSLFNFGYAVIYLNCDLLPKVKVMLKEPNAEITPSCICPSLRWCHCLSFRPHSLRRYHDQSVPVGTKDLVANSTS